MISTNEVARGPGDLSEGMDWSVGGDSMRCDLLSRYQAALEQVLSAG